MDFKPFEPHYSEHFNSAEWSCSYLNLEDGDAPKFEKITEERGPGKKGNI